MREFRGKTVIITGGARGIGRACCLAFAQAGANVVFTYNKSKQRAGELKKELDSLGIASLAVQADVRSYEQCGQVVKSSLEKFEKLDVLINNAGITRDKALLMMTLDDWRDVIDTNLGGVFNMTRSAITTFLKQKEGCIISISSVSGLRGIPRQTNYSAAKAGIIGFSRSLAREVAAYNVRVHTICPGYIDTDMVSSLGENVKKEILGSIPVKRLGAPEEVANLCVFLASGKAGYMTGEVVSIDGALGV